MADNDNRLESKNKVLQSLDLYANDLLNVSKIIGNEYAASVRPRKLEITTSDVTSGTAGDLVLKAGLTTDESGLSGKVRILAGNEEDNCLSSLILNPDGTAFFQETEDLTEEAARINIIGHITEQSTDTSGVINIVGQSQVNIGEGQDSDFASLRNRIQLREETRGNTQVSVLTVNTAEETHSVRTEFRVQNNLDPEHATSVFKVQAEDTSLSSDIGTGYRHEGIQAESNYIDIHARNGLKISNDRADNYLSLTRDDSDPLNSAYLISGYSDDIQLQADNEIKISTPKNSNDIGRYVTLSSTDSDSKPGLGIQNSYSDIQAEEQLTVYNNAGNKITLTAGSSDTGDLEVTTSNGTFTGTESLLLQVPDDSTGSNTHISLGDTLELQAADGLDITIVNGDSSETVDGGKTITASSIDLVADDGYITLQSQTSSNYLTLDHTQDTLRANNQTAKINSRDKLIIENNNGDTVPESPTTNYIKLTGNGQIEEKSGTITEIGTTSITLKADDANNQIVLAKTDGAAENPKSSLLTVQNNYETHKTGTEFKVLVPSTAAVATGTTAAGTLLDLTTTTADLSSPAVTVTTSGAYTLNTFGNVQQTLKPAADHTFTITATKSGSEAPENSLKFDQSDSSLTAKNAKTAINTGTLDFDASAAVTLDTPSLEIKVPTSSSKFTLSADSSDSTLTVNNLNVKNEETLGTSSAVIPVTGYLNDLGLSISNSAVIKSIKSGANFKLGFPVTGLNGEALLEIDCTAVTDKTFTNDLDVKGNIRIGSFSSPTSVSATSKGISAGFTGYAGTLGQKPDQTITINSGSIDLDLYTTLDIDTAGPITIDSKDSTDGIKIGTAEAKPVTINASDLTVTGNGAQTNNLQITSNSVAGSYTTAGQSYIQSDVMKVESDFYGNNVHMYWDQTTGSLVFASVAGNS